MALASVKESRVELGLESGSELVLRLELGSGSWLASVWAIGLVSASALELELELAWVLVWALALASVSALG
jgi:hypothetical protein